MLIDERGLCRALREAWRVAGYTIINGIDAVTIYTEEFLLATSWDKLPRKALGLIAEQIGYLPTEAGALQIAKDEMPQTVLDDAAGGTVAAWTDHESAAEASFVPLKLWGHQVYQTGTRTLYGVKPRVLGLIDERADEAEIWDGERAAWSLGDELVVLRAFRPDGEAAAFDPSITAAWKALEAVDLRPAGE